MTPSGPTWYMELMLADGIGRSVTQTCTFF